jgi:hypothetical protein
MARGRNLVLVIAAGLLVATIAVGLFDWRVAAGRESVDEIHGEISSLLPTGSAEQVVLEYFSDRGLTSTEFTPGPTDSIVVSEDLPTGKTVLVTGYGEDGGLILVPSREIALYFVLDDQRRLERIVVDERIGDPCFTC